MRLRFALLPSGNDFKDVIVRREGLRPWRLPFSMRRTNRLHHVQSPTHSPTHFADLLKRLRLAAALTQEELAERARLSVRGLSDLERGARTHPYKHTVQQLIRALDLKGEEAGSSSHELRSEETEIVRGPCRPSLLLYPLHQHL
jgi:hypothetical protein